MKDRYEMKHRLRKLRSLTGLSRIGIEQASQKQIKASNLGAMEDGVSAPNLKMIIKLVEFYESKNIFIDLKWFIFGKGIEPFIKDDDNLFETNINSIKESEYFRKINPDSIVLAIQQNNFAPRFIKGQIVGAIKVKEQEFNNDYLLIPELENNIFKVSSFKDDTTIKHILFYNHSEIYKICLFGEIENFYNIVWSRRTNL